MKNISKMNNNEKVINPESIKAAIISQALILKRKKEIHEEVQRIENELKTLNESTIGMVGSFGFKHPNDISHKTKTGFVNDFQNISHIAALEQEMAPVAENALSEEVMNEFTKLKEEIARLTKENEELKNIKTNQ